MKRMFFLIGLLLSIERASTQNITAAEYFFDTDPGAGSGTPIVIGSPGTTVNFTTLISTASLANGFHTLAIRTKDASNVWGLFETRTVYVTAAAMDATAVIAAEYFIDTDPGAGNGSAISISPGGNTVTFTAIIPTASLSEGFHILAIRTRNADGTWGLFETRSFVVMTAAVDAPAIAAAEYFIDTDPGPGNGTVLSIGASGNTVTFTSLIPLPSLANGIHSMGIRTRNTAGTWGLYETRPFYISTATGDMEVITAAEYFIDNDPGVGNGSPLTVTSPGITINQTFSCNVPGGTPAGQHILVIRTRDANNTWSIFEAATFEVTGSLPVDLLLFAGHRSGDKVALKWITENEVNNSHFEIERSSNGVDFTVLGRVNPLLGNGRKDYYFDDLQPLQGINYYRLKQVDLDANFKYSQIIRIDMGRKYSASISPNPARDKITISGSDLFKVVEIFDMGGRIVKRFIPTQNNQYDVHDLAAGIYTVRLINADRVVAIQFVRQ